MKTADTCFKRSLVCAAALLSLAFAVAAPAEASGDSAYCEIRLTGCPQTYDKKTDLTVPLNVVALSPLFMACGTEDSVETLSGGTPAVMFLIDHSGSMTTMGSPGSGRDTLGNRFRVTKALIDTIYKVYPDAQVGVAIFAEGLVLNSSHDKNLVPFGGVTHAAGGPNQSYLPLRPLNSPAVSGGYTTYDTAKGVVAWTGDPTWINVIHGMFNVPSRDTAHSTLRNGATGGKVDERAGTNISIAFEAALEAFKTTKIPKYNQYIIFLSDGGPELYGYGPGGENGDCGKYPNLDPGNERCKMQYDFIEGKDTPTTFTVFLRAFTTTPIPPELTNMTANIKKNGYSDSNKSSAIWALSSNYRSLLSFMMTNIVTPMFSKRSSGEAKSIVISTSAGAWDSTGTITDGNFILNRRLPLDTAEVTDVAMGIRYDVQIDTIITRPDGTKDTLPLPVKDSLFNYAFKIRRTATPGGNWLSEQGLDYFCGNRPNLDLRFADRSLVGGEVKGNMDVLQIIFDNTGGLFDYPDSVVVQVLNADSDVSDSESFTLTKDADGKWRYQFPREINSSATPGDGKLQHTGQDSVILVFRNPDVPLDTIRVAVPYTSNAMAFYDKDGNPADTSVHLLPNDITVVAGKSVDIYAKLFDDEDNWDSVMTYSGRISWASAGGPPDVALVEDGAHCVFRTETAGGTYTVTANYTDGAMVISKQVTITVKPGTPAYFLEVVTDSTQINYGRVTNKDGITDIDYLKNRKEYTFKRDVDNAVFYAVLRDAYGNYIDAASGSYWIVEPRNNTISVVMRGDSSYAAVSRYGTTFNDKLYIIVEKIVVREDGTDTTVTDTVHITVVGESTAAVTPNPLVIPGNNPIMDRLEKIDTNGRLVDLYGPIVIGSKSGGGRGAGGVLVTATAPRSIMTKGGDSNVKYVAYAKAIIYDAVGRIVFRSKHGDIVTQDSNTFGFVWDGKNLTGKAVGPGTYAMQITVTMTNGERFFVQRMIGIKLIEN